MLNELTEGEAKPVEIDGYRLAVFLHAGQPRVLDDACPHAGASMSGGWIQDNCAVCPRHLWRFDLTDGKIAGTGGDGMRVYASRMLPFKGQTLVQAELAMP